MPALLLLAGFYAAPTAQAQTSMPLYTTTYCVQVQWSFWRSGGSYWSTEYETSDLGDAQLVFNLFESAFENGTLCEILGCDVTSWVPVDVRLKTVYEWNFYPVATRYANVTKLYTSK
ncbi:hypothetical protein FYK55_10170 [Roseiconus nitratireducens]|uniref:Uncharacterized protein n=1 Tax=Roseiconus nitratireducens TaxID=2605748 RepID=A0A5M6DB83_9BACT|nr:hypothetical protein [Roseiconus nitratireducens]KAA5543572.1 hypothetical protein FYK55_10170 [Roseiconus nitratireducens]